MSTVYGQYAAYGFSDLGDDWRHSAACRDLDGELFFPVGSALPALRQEEQAKKVCARCPVSTECLKWALATDQTDGVWGGTSEMERRAMKRRGARASAR